MLNSKCEYLQNCITRITVNEETWERKERERREEESEKEEELRLEAFKLAKLSTQRGKRKRKASCLEKEEEGEETVVGIMDTGPQQRTRRELCQAWERVLNNMNLWTWVLMSPAWVMLQLRTGGWQRES